jgi:16S rRNA (uracil1498-N3)-methyltransferase
VPKASEARLPRFFVEGVHGVGDVVALAAGDARKLTVVLRRRSGDAIEVCDSAGKTFVATLSGEGDGVWATLVEQRASVAEPRIALTLAQAVPKGAKMDFVIEKATELGVVRIVPLTTERTLADATAAKVARWRRLAASASAQCGRASLPVIEPPQSLDAFLAAPAVARLIVPWEVAERTPLRSRLPSLIGGVESAAVVIGPEGGLSHAEVDRAAAAGAAIVSLGSRILRTETAGLAMIAALLYAAGEF